MGKPFANEIDALAETCSWAFQQNICELKRLMVRWTDGPLIIVGSGGSYSAAIAWAEFHQEAYGQPSYHCTPLELPYILAKIQNSRVLLVSAEAKNNDILNAANVAKEFDVPCAAVMLTGSNLLTRFEENKKSLYCFIFNMSWGKDGYLATNTLLATVLIAARSYFSVDEESIRAIVCASSIKNYRNQFNEVSALTKAREFGLLVLYGPASSLFALDLESKLSEVALAKCEITNFRQFAHGRHLQLAQEDSRLPTVVVAHTKPEESLAKATIRNFPPSISYTEVLILGESSVERNVSSLVNAFVVTETVGKSANIDPGQPEVPEFGRKIYAQNVAEFSQTSSSESLISVAIKRKINFARIENDDLVLFVNKAKGYVNLLEKCRFKALICDFDGTLCNAHQRYSGINIEVAERLTKLLQNGLYLGVATGRGNSVVKNLKEIIPKSLWSQIWIGRYSGSAVERLDGTFETPTLNSDLKLALEYLKTTTLRNYANISDDKRVRIKAGQLSIAVSEHFVAERIASVIREWFSKTNRTGWRVFTSGHSVDILDENTTKLNVINHMAKCLKLDPESEFVRIGDSGQAGGNDYELLQTGYSLSADKVSDSLDCCWNFAPTGLRQAEATNFYLDLIKKDNEGLCFDFLRSSADTNSSLGVE